MNFDVLLISVVVAVVSGDLRCRINKTGLDIYQATDFFRVVACRMDQTLRHRMQEKHALGLLEEWSSGLTDVQPRRLRMVGLEKQWCQNGGARTSSALRSRYASKCIAACDRYVIGEASLG